MARRRDREDAGDPLLAGERRVDQDFRDGDRPGECPTHHPAAEMRCAKVLAKDMRAGRTHVAVSRASNNDSAVVLTEGGSRAGVVDVAVGEEHMRDAGARPCPLHVTDDALEA